MLACAWGEVSKIGGGIGGGFPIGGEFLAGDFTAGVLSGYCVIGATFLGGFVFFC